MVALFLLHWWVFRPPFAARDDNSSSLGRKLCSCFYARRPGYRAGGGDNGQDRLLGSQVGDYDDDVINSDRLSLPSPYESIDTEYSGGTDIRFNRRPYYAHDSYNNTAASGDPIIGSSGAERAAYLGGSVSGF